MERRRRKVRNLRGKKSREKFDEVTQQKEDEGLEEGPEKVKDTETTAGKKEILRMMTKKNLTWKRERERERETERERERKRWSWWVEGREADSMLAYMKKSEGSEYERAVPNEKER